MKTDLKSITVNFVCSMCAAMVIALIKSQKTARVHCKHCRTQYAIDLKMSYKPSRKYPPLERGEENG